MTTSYRGGYALDLQTYTLSSPPSRTPLATMPPSLLFSRPKNLVYLRSFTDCVTPTALAKCFPPARTPSHDRFRLALCPLALLHARHPDCHRKQSLIHRCFSHHSCRHPRRCDVTTQTGTRTNLTIKTIKKMLLRYHFARFI